MKKRLLITVVIIIILITNHRISYALNYFVDAVAGDDVNSGTTQTEPLRTLEKVSTWDFQPGDRIFIKAGTIYRGTLKVSSRGTAEAPIIYCRYGMGDNPKIFLSGSFKNWIKVEPGVWKGTIKGRKNHWGAVWQGKRVEQYLGYKYPGDKRAAPQSLADMLDGYFYSPLNSSSFYFRSNQGKPGEMEIGARSYGIEIRGAAFVIIDGIDVFGPGGRETNGSAGTSIQILVNNCNNITIKNSALSGHHRRAISIENGSWQCTVDSCRVYNIGSTGIYLWQAGKGNSVVKTEVFDCGTHDTDYGDRGHIGVFQTPGATVSNCYVHENGHPGQSGVDAAISFVQSPEAMVTRCRLERTGGVGIQFAENTDYSTAAYNIIDTFGLYPDLRHNRSGIKIGGGSRASTAKGCKILNNLIMNGGTTTPGEWAALRIHDHSSIGLMVINNIFYNNGRIYDIYAESPDDFKGWIFSNNCFYRKLGLAIKWGKTIYDAQHILGKGKGYYSSECNQERNSIVADPLIDFDKLSLKEGSPCIANGLNVGLLVDYHGVPLPQGTAVDIGPFESKLHRRP